jgi:Chromate transporter
VAAAVHRPKVPYPTQAREYCFCEVARRGVLVSTPGPLIMVNTFVGFLAGYNVEGGLAWGFLGATIATLCTFVPSVVFHHQRRADHRPDPHHRRVRSLAQRITIGVVGVVAGLAVFVARHAASRMGSLTGWSSSSPSSCSSAFGASESASSRSSCSALRSASRPLSSTARENGMARNAGSRAPLSFIGLEQGTLLKPARLPIPATLEEVTAVARAARESEASELRTLGDRLTLNLARGPALERLAAGAFLEVVRADFDALRRACGELETG